MCLLSFSCIHSAAFMEKSQEFFMEWAKEIADSPPRFFTRDETAMFGLNRQGRHRWNKKRQRRVYMCAWDRPAIN